MIAQVAKEIGGLLIDLNFNFIYIAVPIHN